MSIKGWEAYFKVIRFQPVHAPIIEATVGQDGFQHPYVKEPGTSQLECVREDHPALQLVLR